MKSFFKSASQWELGEDTELKRGQLILSIDTPLCEIVTRDHRAESATLVFGQIISGGQFLDLFKNQIERIDNVRERGTHAENCFIVTELSL